MDGKDQRLKIIEQENDEQGLARNNALGKDQGEHIGFVDSDDRIATSISEELYTKVKKENADIVFCETKFYNNANVWMSQAEWTNLQMDKKYYNTSFNQLKKNITLQKIFNPGPIQNY